MHSPRLLGSCLVLGHKPVAAAPRIGPSVARQAGRQSSLAVREVPPGTPRRAASAFSPGNVGRPSYRVIGISGSTALAAKTKPTLVFLPEPRRSSGALSNPVESDILGNGNPTDPMTISTTPGCPGKMKVFWDCHMASVFATSQLRARPAIWTAVASGTSVEYLPSRRTKYCRPTGRRTSSMPCVGLPRSFRLMRMSLW